MFKSQTLCWTLCALLCTKGFRWQVPEALVVLCYFTDYCYFTAIVMWSSVYHPVREILIFLAAFLFDSAQVSWMVIKGKYLIDLISHRSILLVSRLSITSLTVCVSVMLSKSKVNSHKHFTDLNFKASNITQWWLLQNALRWQQWCTNKRPALFLLFWTADLVQALSSTGMVSLESWTARETEGSYWKTAFLQT